MSALTSLAKAQDARDAIRKAARARRIALRLTQADLAERSGVPIATLKRFEQQGVVAPDSLLSIAVALDAVDAFLMLFPLIEATTLAELERTQRPAQRVRRRAGARHEPQVAR